MKFLVVISVALAPASTLSLLSSDSLAPLPPNASPEAEALPNGAVVRLGTPLWRLPAEGRRLILSPDGAAVLVATDSLHVERIDAKTGRRLVPLGTPTFAWGFDVAAPVAVSPDSGLVAAADYDREGRWTPYLSVRRSGDGRELRQFKFDRKPQEPKSPPTPAGFTGTSSTSFVHLSAAAFSPDGKTVAAASRLYYRCTTSGGRGQEERVLLEAEDVTVGLWDLDSGRLRHEMTGHAKEVHTLLFSADGKTLATASKDGTVRFWDVKTGRESDKPWKADGPIYSASSSPDGNLFAIGCEKVVLVRDVNTGRVRHKLEVPAAEVLSVAFSPDGKTLAAAGGDTIRFWSAADGKALGDVRPAKSVRAVVFAGDGKTAFSVHKGEQRVRRWDVTTHKPVPEADGHSGPIRFLTFAPDGKQIFAFALGDDFKLWDARRGKSEALKPDDSRVMTAMLAASGRTRPVFCEDAFAGGFALLLGKANRLEHIPGLLGCSVDGRRVLCAEEKDKKPVLTVNEVGAKKTLREIACENGEEGNATLSPGGETVAVAAGGSLCFIEVATGERRRYPLATKNAKPGDVFFSCSGVKFSSDATRVAVLGDTGVLRVVAVADGRLIREIDTGEKDVSGVAFSPDGKTLLTTATLGGVSVWEVATGRRVRSEPAGSYLFAAGNRTVASNTEKGLRLCDLYTGEVIRECKVPDAGATTFTLSPDGLILAGGYTDCTIVLWDARPPAKPGKPIKLDAKRLEGLWSDLEGPDATRAYAAIGLLVADPQRAVPFLGKRLRPAEPVDAKRLARWIAELDGKDPEAQEAAARELYRLGTAAESPLRAALKKEPTAGARARLERLLAKLEKNPNGPAPGELSDDRAIQALERIGTKESHRVLDLLSRGAEGAPTTVAAREALFRTPLGGK